LLATFVLPVLLFAFLWYQVILGEGLFSVFHHADFGDYNSSDVVPSYFFVGNFLLNYGLGWFFISATVFSLLICFLHRKVFSKILVFDLICLTTIASVVSVNTFLGASLNLKAPYYNAIKYDYQSLPFFSLLAAALPSKCFLLLNSAKSKRKFNRVLTFSVALIGLFLVASSIFVNIVFANFFSRWNYLLFRVEMDKNVGYSLFNPTPTDKYSPLMNIQYLGFAFVLSGLAWANRHKLADALKSQYCAGLKRKVTSFLVKHEKTRFTTKSL
jgi:hypothetical protein